MTNEIERSGKNKMVQKEFLFGKYHMLDRIGTGGTSEVFLVHHNSLQVHRAMKRVKKNSYNSENFLREVNLLKNLRHPGIPMIYDIEEDEECFYIIEEYVEGTSFDKFFLQYPEISIERKWNFCQQLCGIVAYLHSQRPHPILHLDIKPQNIMLMNEKVMLIDFGTAIFRGKTSESEYLSVTPRYAAPELLEGEHVDQRADVYSLALVLKEILGTVIEKDLLELLENCTKYDQSQRRVTAADLWMWFDKNSHRFECFSNVVYITGTQNRIGITHFALTLVSCLNHEGIEAVYVNLSGRSVQEEIFNEHTIHISENGLIHIKGSKCCFLCEEEKPFEWLTENPDRWLIIDGEEVSQGIPERYSNIVLLCGGRPWEKELTFYRQEQLEMNNDCRMLYLYNYGKPSIPYVADPLEPSWRERRQMRYILGEIRKMMEEKA